MHNLRPRYLHEARSGLALMFYLSRRLTGSFSDIGFFNKAVTQHGARALDKNYVEDGGFISNGRVHFHIAIQSL